MTCSLIYFVRFSWHEWHLLKTGKSAERGEGPAAKDPSLGLEPGSITTKDSWPLCTGGGLAQHA